MVNGGKHNPGELEPVAHVYVHIPFCARICPYCAFYKDHLDRSQTGRFCDALLAELGAVARQYAPRPKTIFWGGGTPTALTTEQLRRVLAGFRETLDLGGLQEWTTEANPGSVSERKAAILLEGGITRLSMGVQSWDDGLLQLLGREHSAQQAENSFRTLRAAGFKNINVDLMYGLPGQRIGQWKETLRRTISLEPESVSAYCLTYEEDTDFFLRHARGELRSDSDTNAGFFEIAMELMEKSGYEHYEISNYARPGFRSLHNQGYWTGNDYLGIGPSAFSTVGMKRWQNISDYRAYADRLLRGESVIASVEELTPEAKRIERVALSLRTDEGVAREVLADYSTETGELIALGLMREANGRYVLTRKGKSVADSVAEALV